MPPGSSGGRSGNPKAALLRACASRTSGKALSGCSLMHGRQTASSRAMKADVVLQTRQVPIPKLYPAPIRREKERDFRGQPIWIKRQFEIL